MKIVDIETAADNYLLFAAGMLLRAAGAILVLAFVGVVVVQFMTVMVRAVRVARQA